ncbi:MAG: FKBP-type peptidyl-prolyl cis-trans isomerase [Clostridia bacterium]|nr:FKBP-type peptidyl-prolyl cis-trans isomerase [Clostridia bacterium]
MKKILSMILVIVLCMITATACATPSDGDGSTADTADSSSNTTTGDTDDEATTADGKENDDAEQSGTAYGFWYCRDNGAVIKISEGSSDAIFYSLATGYYAYYAKQDATYTLDGDQLVLTIGEDAYTLTYDSSLDTLTLNDLVYTRKSEAPTEHPIYTFPDFASIEFSGNEKLISADKVDTTAYIEEARLDIFHDYYSSSIEEYREITDRPARRGDYVNVDYIGYHNGVAFQGGSANASMISIIENSGYIPGFAEGIIGHTAGESFDVNVTFPENYDNVTLAGQPVTFKMTLNAIYDVTLSEEQFASYENIEYETYEEYVIATAKNTAAESIFTLLALQSEINDVIPEEAYMYFYQYQLDQAHYMAYYYNLDYDTYLSYFGLSETSMLVSSKTVALDYIVAYHIAKTAGLTWTDEQYQEKFDVFVEEMVNAGYTEAEATEYVTNNQQKHVETELTYQIASEWFIEQVFAD